MKNLILSLLVVLFFHAPVFASKDLARSKNCLSCHSVDNQIVGPSYKEVAKKYVGNEEAATLLAKKIREGGSGVWGSMPMPPNPQVSEAEASVLVRWILELK